MQNFEQAAAFIHAIGAANEIVDFRAIHDANKGIPAIPFRDTLANAWPSICYYNSQGYGIFAVIAQLDGAGRELANVQAIRAHYADLDGINSEQNMQRANGFVPAPAFAVATSPGKYHVYWPLAARYAGNDRFQLMQRKIAQFFEGDKAVIDAARVMRLPGTLNTKYSNPQSDKYQGTQPHLVTCFALAGYGTASSIEQLEQALANVNVTVSTGGRKPLGTPELAAPDLGWLRYSLAGHDPNQYVRGDWVRMMAAIKQAGWSRGTEQEVYAVFTEWCERYDTNDPAENLKQWNSIRDSEVGWPFIEKRSPHVIAPLKLGNNGNAPPAPAPQPGQPPATPGFNGGTPATPPPPAPPGLDCSGEILTGLEQKQWFKDCYYVGALGKILTPKSRYMGASEFNGEYGGKKFIIDQQGKVTNEPWQAATRSTVWTVPKVDHVRFLPSKPFGEKVEDDLGRVGLNIYRPAKIELRDGNPAPFLQWLERVLPVESDRKILLDYLAHNVKFPGDKIPWAPVIQSTEGIGKGAIIKRVMEHAIGYSYTHDVNAKELAESGGKFNAWMRHKLWILADEIKVDDTRDMIEVLKPMITEESIEVQGKGENQVKEDNFANWIFFTNWKNAVPISKHGRRFSVFYSAIQSVDDLHRLGMDDTYFNWLRAWVNLAGGKQIVANWLMRYPIERGSLPGRAPLTSSTQEALKQSRGPLEQLIADAVEDGLAGFRGGWISTLAVHKLMAERGHRSVSPKTVTAILEGMQYYDRGRATRPYFAEDTKVRSQLYHIDRVTDIASFGPMQGYGEA